MTEVSMYWWCGCEKLMVKECRCLRSVVEEPSPPPVTRKEYDALFLAMTRLTDRIETLESLLTRSLATVVTLEERRADRS